MHKKRLIILIVVTLLTFANCLSNGFVGDDEFLFIKNPFFHSWENFPKLFTSEYIADQDAIFNDDEEGINSGSVAYRPVLSTTFFFDYWLWQDNPFGYHLTNVILHIANTLLIYFLIFLVLKEAPTAFLAALLFSVHPLKSEPVASIGYRADALACFFILLAFLFFLSSKTKGKVPSFISHLFFFLAVFTKESAVVFPALILTYDWLVEEKPFISALRELRNKYFGYVLILLFYLFIYISVFPNSSLDGSKVLEEGVGVQIVTILRVFSHYLIVFVLPFLVKLLPPLYTPQIETLFGIKTWIAAGVILSFLFIFVKTFRENKTAFFFLLWFLICFIPVSNIIVIANPMAYRFMYLPSVGLATFFAIVIMQLMDRLRLFQENERLKPILISAIAAICMVTTVFLNINWQSNTMMALGMVKDFPNYPIGYLHAGMSYFNAGMKDKAKELLTRAIDLGLKDPRGYYLMGLCLFDDPEASKPYFEKSIKIFPKFAHAHTALGRIHLYQQNYNEAFYYLQSSVQLSPDWKAYGYLMQLFLLLDQADKAKYILDNAKSFLSEKEFGYLSYIYDSVIEDQVTLPVDFGV